MKSLKRKDSCTFKREISLDNQERIYPLRRGLEGKVSDWRSYDEIAERYDRVWSARFEAVARHIWALVPPRASDNVLDIGTGTGIVPMTLGEVTQASGLAVGCDRSAGMLLRARARVSRFRVLVADATALPFRGESFDLATASFVLSHVRDYLRALAEALRVLKPSGLLAVSNWAPPSDPYSSAWSECLAEAISKPEAERAMAEVAPWEGHFSQQGHLESALTQAGFSVVRCDAVEFELLSHPARDLRNDLAALAKKHNVTIHFTALEVASGRGEAAARCRCICFAGGAGCHRSGRWWESDSGRRPATQYGPVSTNWMQSRSWLMT